ncbi:MAG: FHA domain-containing protein [Symploca sp. SIO3C6]|nr:FHA domain-containing protein [Symploca sp. SIO3C6]
MSTKRRMQPFSICKHTSAQRYKFLNWTGSKNGTFVNGSPINYRRPSFRPLRHGDQLCLAASCRFHFQEILAATEMADAPSEADQTTMW